MHPKEINKCTVLYAFKNAHTVNSNSKILGNIQNSNKDLVKSTRFKCSHSNNDINTFTNVDVLAILHLKTDLQEYLYCCLFLLKIHIMYSKSSGKIFYLQSVSTGFHFFLHSFILFCTIIYIFKGIHEKLHLPKQNLLVAKRKIK
jgi:hypothetical protein